MPQTEHGGRRENRDGRDEHDERTAERRGHRPSNVLARTVVGTGVAIIGLVLVVFALGQAVGLDLLGALGQALSSQTGRWLAVAFVALIMTGAALRALRYW